MECAYCERPLICEGCQTEYIPPSAEHYQALSRAEDVIECPACGAILVCHWCKTPYDGSAGDQDSDAPAGDG